MNHGQYTSFDDPNAGTVANLNTGFFPGTDAVDVNNRGQVVGFYIDANNVEHSFLLSGGQFTTIDPPGAANIPGPSFTNVDQASHINDHGQIVGGYTDANDVTHGYLLRGGKYTTLNDPNAGTLTFATGINNSGQIVGFDFDATGLAHGFLATPAHRK
jgi:probable HAF family extracellular repeat protein